MKAILINATNRTVTEVEINDDLQSIYKVMGVDMIQTATYLPKNDIIYVDEEGMLKPMMNFFIYEGAHQPFAGNGLVVGTSRGGKTVAPKISVDEVRKNVKFANIFEIKLMIARGELQ